MAQASLLRLHSGNELKNVATILIKNQPAANQIIYQMIYLPYTKF
jgi:hypothetical protein